jgi:hypothetical protein
LPLSTGKSVEKVVVRHALHDRRLPARNPVGVATTLVVRGIAWPGMVLAMLIGMAAGMIVHLLLGLILSNGTRQVALSTSSASPKTAAQDRTNAGYSPRCAVRR